MLLAKTKIVNPDFFGPLVYLILFLLDASPSVCYDVL